MALLTSSKNEEKPDQGFRRSGAEVLLTAPPRPIFARALGEWARPLSDKGGLRGPEDDNDFLRGGRMSTKSDSNWNARCAGLKQIVDFCAIDIQNFLHALRFR